jgi:transcriptional regulator with XRE-family HTH domain
MSQGKNSQIVKKNNMPVFGKRLRAAFDGAKNAEIARKLKISEPAAKNYLEGRVPDAQTLLQIADLTNCSLHWLLTGEGPVEREIVRAIKDGVVDIDHIRHETLIDHYISQVQRLAKEEKARKKSKELKQVVNGS